MENVENKFLRLSPGLSSCEPTKRKCHWMCWVLAEVCALPVLLSTEKFKSISLVYLMQVFHWSRPAGNYAFLESQDQCLHGRLALVVFSQPVGESR